MGRRQVLAAVALSIIVIDFSGMSSAIAARMMPRCENACLVGV